jgi:5-methylcytosine-specific restriction endonuclease McrA
LQQLSPLDNKEESAVIDNKFKSLAEQLRNLNNEDLVSQLHLAVRGERRMTLRVLHHLNEMERRKLHLDLGYSSLFDYCTRKLEYSASAAGRRIQAARCVRSYPDVLRLLEDNELSLSTIGLIEPILTDENCASILERVRSASYREVESVASEYRPPVALRDQIRHVRVSVPPPKDVDEAVIDRLCARATPGAGSAYTEQKLFVQFLADDELLDLFEEVRTLLTRNGDDKSFGEVVKIVLAEYRERHSPSARKQRRDARKGAASPDSRRRECGTTGERSRYITSEVRDDVFARDGGRCSYVAGDGTRCGSGHGLQVDHVQPFAAGGLNESANLRLLCAAHNKRTAERTFGTDTMERFHSRE